MIDHTEGASKTTEEGPELPTFLRERFDVTELVESPSTLVALAPTGTILWVNAAWSKFAWENGGTEILTKFGPGASYFDGLSPQLRGFYEEVVQRALQTGEPFIQDYECSSPEKYRIYRLRALPIGTDGLLLEHSLVVERPHEDMSAAAIDARYKNAEGLIVQCANCRRVRRVDEGGWDCVRPWDTAIPPNASHSICAACVGYYWGLRLRGKAK